MKTIFFSWQSDIKSVRNKLQSALQIAIKELGNELEEANRPELDSDTQGTFGSEEILTTIFAKIEACALFVADVTPIAKRGSKLVPNPNVLFEAGYALKAKSTHTRLYIFCNTNEINVDIEKMPFDIKGKKLFGFDHSDTPKAIATRLRPMLEGMLLQQTGTTDDSEYPYIYVDGATFTNWADGKSATLSIYNSEDKEYQLDAIEIEGKSAEPFRGLKPNISNGGIEINGVTNVFLSDKPVINMTVSRAGKKYRLQQSMFAPKGADDRYHFAKFIESSVLIPQ